MKKLPIIFRFPWIICASVVLRFLCLFVFVFHCTKPYWWLTPRKYNKKKEKSRERIDEKTSETKSFWVSGCVTPFRKRQKMWDNTHTHTQLQMRSPHRKPVFRFPTKTQAESTQKVHCNPPEWTRARFYCVTGCNDPTSLHMTFYVLFTGSVTEVRDSAAGVGCAIAV